MEPTDLHTIQPVSDDRLAPATSQVSPEKKTDKTLFVVVTVAAVIVALLLGTIIFLLTNKNTVHDTQGTSSSSKDNSATTAASQTVIATKETLKSGIFVDLYEPRRSGNTLVLNYRLYNKETEGVLWADAPGTGIYQSSSTYAGRISEPYAVSNTTNQKYGLVRDANGQILATKEKYAWLKKGQSINGYVTVALPPDGSVITVSLGDMQTFTDIKVAY